MNECCVNASAVIFRQNRSLCAVAVSLAVAQGNVAAAMVFSQGGNSLKCLCLSKSPGNPAETLHLHRLQDSF